MRTRIRTVINETVSLPAQVVSFEEEDSPGVPFTRNMPAQEINISTIDELMTDVDTGDRIKPNPCEHKRQEMRILSANQADYVEASNAGHSGRATYHGRAGWWYEASRQVLGTVPWDIVREATPSRLSVQVPQVDEISLLQDLLDRASGQIADHALNLAELHQLPLGLKGLRSLALPSQKSWKKFQRALIKAKGHNGLPLTGDFVKDLKRLNRAPEGIVLKGLASKVANAHLAYKFGIAPLLSDIEKTWRFVKNSNAKLSKYQKNKPIRLSKKFPVTGLFNDTVQGLFTPVNGKYLWESKPSLGQFVGECVYVLTLKPNLQGPRSLLGPLNDLVNRFGPSGPTAFAWELVPYSFVVDWFVDLRSVLRGFDTLFGVNPFKIIGFTRSVRWHATAYMDATNRETDYSSIISWPAAEFQWKYYMRSIVKPRIQFRSNIRFGKNQLLLSASLITQFLLRLRKFR
jgi:hypothetical protein